MNHVPRSSQLAIGVVLALAISNAATLCAQTTPAVEAQVETASISGSITHNAIAGLVSQTVDISPVDESVTTGSGANTMTASSAQNTVMGIPLYTLANMRNSTNACDTQTCDQGNGTASEGSLSLLGGLVTASNITESGSGNVNPYATNPAQVQITTGASIGQIGGTGLQVPSGIYAPGTQVPVSGMITVPLLNVLGVIVGSQQEPFTGIVTLQANHIDANPGNTNTEVNRNVAGTEVDFESSAIRLQGSAPDGLGGNYDVDVASVLYRIQLLGFNAIRLPFSFQALFNKVPVNQ